MFSTVAEAFPPRCNGPASVHYDFISPFLETPLFRELLRGAGFRDGGCLKIRGSAGGEGWGLERGGGRGG